MKPDSNNRRVSDTLLNRSEFNLLRNISYYREY
jgi:hypothetical protein